MEDGSAGRERDEEQEEREDCKQTGGTQDFPGRSGGQGQEREIQCTHTSIKFSVGV